MVENQLHLLLNLEHLSSTTDVKCTSIIGEREQAKLMVTTEEQQREEYATQIIASARHSLDNKDG